jgi:Ca2+-binding RTX toxin-like protein
VDFGLEFSAQGGLEVQAPDIALVDVTLDLGDFIGGFASDLLGGIKAALDPLEWLIGPDGLLNMRLPIISDLLGETIRLRDLMWVFDQENAPKVDTFLNFVEKLYWLIDLVDEASGMEFGLNFGDLVLFDSDGSFATDFPDLFDKPFNLIPSFGDDIRRLPSFDSIDMGEIQDAVGNAVSGIPSTGAAPSTQQSFTAGVTDEGGITFPILEADTIFGLLMGKPATLFLVELPELGFEFMYRQVIPIWGPLAATFGGGISGGIDFGFGYDTLGLSQTLATKNPAYLLNGFFLNDVDPETGADRAEAFISAEIFAGAAISLGGVATAGVEGGIEANIDFNLNDPDRDTKVRFSEISSNIVANSYNPLAMFDISGQIDFFMRAFLEVDLFLISFSEEWEFLRLTLYEFEIPFNRPGVLASQSGDTLTLNIGTNAAARIQGDTSDGNETIIVESLSPGNVAVYSTQFNVDRFSATTNPFTKVSKIIVNGGEGNDTIDLSKVDSSIEIEAHGGAGNDIIWGGDGADTLYGDDGIDEIHGGGGADEIHGGRGDDTLYGDANPAGTEEEKKDKLYGEEGNDKLYGGDGGSDTGDNDDILDGGLGDDTVYTSAGSDIVALESAGSFDLIDATTVATPILDLSDKPGGVSVFVQGNTILIGFGEQHETTANILGTDVSTINVGNHENYFDSVVLVTNASNINEIIGGDAPDTFFVQRTTSSTSLTLDGGLGADKYVFFTVDHLGAATTINATVEDQGELLQDENVIEIIGYSGSDDILVTNEDIQFGNTSVIGYVPPSEEPNVYSDQLQIIVKGDNTTPKYGGGGSGNDDTITIESTYQTVPVRVEGGPGDDTITVGGSAGSTIMVEGSPVTVKGLDAIQSFLNPFANEGMGLGPLVLVGGYFDIAASQYVDDGHDTVIVDDSQDDDTTPPELQNKGNLNAFLEVREGIPIPIEVGIVSGLGMSLSQVQLDDNGTPEDPYDDTSFIYYTDGRVEFEGFEVVDVRLGSEDDIITVGGDYNLEREPVSGYRPGEAFDVLNVNSELPLNRLVEPTDIEIREITPGGTGVNEVQSILIKNAPGGSFTLSFG